jgi:serine/threonine protein kinase
MNFDQRYTYNRKTDKLGGRGFGTVYKAYDNVEQTYVALKFFNRSDLLKYNLKAEVLMKLSHLICYYYCSLQKHSIFKTSFKTCTSNIH